MQSFLFKLVQSLSTSEKIYFKRSASTHAKKGDKNYLRIYDRLEQQSHKNDDDLSVLYPDSSIDKHFASECNYLKEKVLTSLFNFHLNGSKRNQIQKGIIMIEMLIKKGFRKQALKKLNFVKRNADKYEELTMILRLIELEELILFKEGIIGYKDQLLKLKEQRLDLSSKIQNLNEYHLLREEVREAQFTENLAVNDTSSFDQLCKNPLVVDPSNCLTLRAKEHWHYIQVLTHYIKRDFEMGLFYASEYLNFTRENIHLFSIKKLLPTLSNYIYHAALTQSKPSFEKGMELLSELSKKAQITDAYFAYIKYTRTLEFAYYTKDSPTLKKYLDRTHDLLNSHRAQFETAQLQYLFMNIARTAIVLENYEKATLVMNQWMQIGALPYRAVQARLFLLIVHFKLGYYDLVQSELALLKKMEHKYLRDQMLIRTFYKFFNKATKHPTKIAGLLTTLQKELKALANTQNNYYDFIAFDYYEWSLKQ